MQAFQDVFQGRIADARQRLSAAQVRDPQDEEVRIAAADLAFLADGDDHAASLEPLNPVTTR